MKVTLQQLAGMAGVSVATVSRVLNGNPAVAPETRKKVLRAAQASGFSGNWKLSGRPLVALITSRWNVSNIQPHLFHGNQRPGSGVCRACSYFHGCLFIHGPLNMNTAVIMLCNRFKYFRGRGSRIAGRHTHACADCAQGDGFYHIRRAADAAAGHKGNLIPDALSYNRNR